MTIISGEHGLGEIEAWAPTRTVLRFGKFALHLGDRLYHIEQQGQQFPIALGSRAFDVLTLLVQRAGELVPKRAIIEAVWPRSVVEDSNLAVQISSLRKVLDVDRGGDSCIRTVPGRGYCFIADVTEDAQALPSGVIPSTRRLSIIVLPLRCRGNADDETMADAIADGVATELGSFPTVTVIAYKFVGLLATSSLDIGALAQRHGVRYALAGTIDCLDDMLHVSVKLISTEDGTQLWADRFEHARCGSAADQEAIVRRLSFMVSNAVFRAESARIHLERPAAPDAVDLVISAQALWSEQTSLQRCAEAQALFEQALALDPQCLPALVGCAYAMLILYADRLYWPDGDEPDRLDKLISDAQAIAPNDASVLNCAATWLERQGRYEAAMPVAQRLMEAYPRNPNGYVRVARCKIVSGEPEEAIPLLEKAIQLDPYEPHLFDRYWRLGFALLLARREREATPWLQRSLGARPHGPGRSRHRMLSACYALMGDVKRAQLMLTDHADATALVTLQCLGYENYRSASYAVLYERWRYGLQLAGLRCHADEAADYGIVVDNDLHPVIAGLTPMTAPGARTVGTVALARLIENEKPVVIDTLGHFWGVSIPGAFGLEKGGIGGRLSDAVQSYLAQKMVQLSDGDRSVPVVAVGFNAERFDGRNLALRLVALGYTNVHWYRGGREAWQTAGLPMAPLVPLA